MEHPPYNPHLAPYDFLLFRAIEEHFSRPYFDSLDDLFIAADSVLKARSEDFLQKVSQEWIQRLQVCCESGGEYFA
jgi:hypothetical protein